MIPDRTLTELFRGTLDLANDTIKLALFKESTEYSPDSAAHEFVADVFDGGTTGAEFDDTNYGRKTLTTTVTEDNNVSEAVFDFADVTFSSLGGSQTIEAVLVYRQVGGDDTTPGDDEIIRIYDDSEIADLPLATNGGDVTFAVGAEGCINLTT